MSQLVVLNLGQGSCQQGCATVVAQLWQVGSYAPMQFIGSLPPAPELEKLYGRWQRLYAALYAHKGWRRLPSQSLGIEIDETDSEVTNISESEFRDLCQTLQQRLNTWLNDLQFRPIDRQLRTQLVPGDEIRYIIMASDRTLLRLPWCLWQFFDDYPNVELALSLPEYRRTVKTVAASAKSAVNILTILGDRQGIDISQDQRLLEQLPHANLKLLVEPDIQSLSQQLWEQSWDMLFFAGHSSSQGKGCIQVNQSENLTIDQLRYGLRRAIANGLKLAIFNSCDGLELAWDLADLQIPQVIVMREPVPDRVAQEFLKHFLVAFSGGQSLCLSVREAREKLQALEIQFPCATWLPTICQNPAELPQRWQEWGSGQTEAEAEPELLKSGRPQSKATRLPPLLQQGRRILLSSLLVTGCIGAGRSLGFLQSLELWAFDRILTLRPYEPTDKRLLIVTIDEADIQAQDPTQRRGSLSDQVLNQALEKLQQAKVIGLDVYRDFPVTTSVPQLATRLRQTQNLFAVCKSSDRSVDPMGTKPPPEVSPDRLGFSDFLEDSDGILRRQILFFTPDQSCPAPYALSSQLALQYLADKGIDAKFTPDQNLQLGSVVFHHLQPHSSGYQTIDARGSQVLLNYRALANPRAIASQISLSQLLKGTVDEKLIRDRIVLIGSIAQSDGDYWSTPYGTPSAQQVPGVLVQAHMVSQILSAVLDHRPLITVWSGWMDGLWIWGWAVAGVVGMMWMRSPLRRAGLIVITIGTLTDICWFLLVQGTWVPLFPAAIALVLCSGIEICYPLLLSKFIRSEL
jgi:CHASE2 domain-containing sensor protein